MNSLEKAANIVLKQCMDLKEKENLLIVFDANKQGIADVFLKNAKKIIENAFSIEMPVAKVNGEEPPLEVAEEMKKYDVVLLVTTKSLSHTNARRDACKGGGRIASMPGITKDMMERALTADYDMIAETDKRIVEALKGKRVLRVTTTLGTDITFFKNNLFDDDGIYHKKGSFGNLPAGEVGFAPVENKTNGVFVIDKTMAGIGRLKSSIKFTVKDGYVVNIEGGDDAEKLNEMLKGFNDKNVYNVAEFSIGTNPNAKITGLTLEDEKVLGTIHIALGDNTSYPGGNTKAPMHLDGVISKPTIFADDEKIMENGNLLV
jgi:leucyl aminopeptidase (aminopeptidase T)